MVRKPQPKDAAKAIQALFVKAGFEVPLGTCQEAVAIVEGHEDWNTMAAVFKRPVAKKQPEKPKADIPDSDGPFRVFVNGGFYDVFASFRHACNAASVFSADDENFNICEVKTNSDRVLATFVGEHMRHQAMVIDWNVPDTLVKGTAPQWDERFAKYFYSEEDLHDFLADEFCASSDEVSGRTCLALLRTFNTDSEGRVMKMPEPVIVFQIQEKGGDIQYFVNTQLTGDLYERIKELIQIQLS